MAGPVTASSERRVMPNPDPVLSDIIQRFGADRGRLLDIAEAIQQRFGHIGKSAVGSVAEALGMHAVEVEDMISFYAFLDRTPRGRCRVRLSRTPISLIKGAGAVAAAFEAALGISIGETTPDGDFTLEWTSDIGMADQEPAALVNRVVLTELTPADVPAIIAAVRAAGDDQPLAALPKANVRPSLVHSGPLLSGTIGRADGIEAALLMSPDEVIAQIAASRVRGRGGAGFPTGVKWRLTRKATGSEHFIVCNADEGEPGTFKDRVLLSAFFDVVCDGMTVAGYALGARQGLLYVRGEYSYLWDSLQQALETRRALGLLGTGICGRPGFDFDIRIQLGAGAYICGEESALLESLEGKRGAPRDRPPFPTERGYLGKPTAIDNVETLVCAARIMAKGATWFTAFGTAESTGTKMMSLSGDCARPGVYEVPFGITVNDLLELAGAPEAAYVQVSGPSGQAVAPKDFGRRIAYEDLSTGGSTMIFGPQRDVVDIALEFAEFFVAESCGWCTPCRVGTTLLKQGMEKIVAGNATLSDIQATEKLAGSVTRMSRCGLGQSAPNPILTTMRNFPQAYEARLRAEDFVPRVDLPAALADAIEVQGRAPTAGEI